MAQGADREKQVCGGAGENLRDFLMDLQWRETHKQNNGRGDFSRAVLAELVGFHGAVEGVLYQETKNGFSPTSAMELLCVLQYSVSSLSLNFYIYECLSFIGEQLTYNKPHIFKLYNLTSFDIHTHS